MGGGKQYHVSRDDSLMGSIKRAFTSPNILNHHYLHFNEFKLNSGFTV